MEKNLYADRANFAEVYPFIPYQFNLLGSVLTSIRTHGASGKHLAEGERSMLALFKDSAERVKDEDTGTIVPFYMFYDALERFLDHSHAGVVARALDNDFLNPEHAQSCFDVDVLKTLFLIKYVKEIRANLENIASLMATHIDNDRMELVQKVEDALRRLEHQTLIQRNGALYVFLTNEEQEINRAIESQPVEPGQITGKVCELIFDDLFGEKKYRYPAFNGRYAFGFNQVVDDKHYKTGQSYDLTLKILTPDSDEISDETTMRMISAQSRVVLVYKIQPQYPGKAQIAKGKKLMGDVAGLRNTAEFFAAIDRNRDDYLDFAEDYEPVKKFFAGEQVTIFDRAIRLMDIYDDSRTFIVNEKIESTVAQIKAIMKKPSPYTEIKNLPGLLDQFMAAYGSLLDEMEEPVLAAIDEARKRVLDELEGKLCKGSLRDRYITRFQELHDKATSCNNVAMLQNIKVEADALKVRCLNEIATAENRLLAQRTAEEEKIRREQHSQADRVSEGKSSYGEEARKPATSAPKVKKQRTVSIKSINAETTWQLETAADVKKYIAQLERKLLAQLEEDTVVHIEF